MARPFLSSAILAALVARIILLAPMLASAQALLQQTPVPNNSFPSGRIYAIAKSGNTVYLGGQFDYLGPLTGGGALVDASTGIPAAGFPVIADRGAAVLSCAPDGAGGWFIGGNFTIVGGKTRNGLAHINSDLTVDDAWVPDSHQDFVNDVPGGPIIVSGSRVYVGGGGGQASSRPVRVYDATTGAELAFNPGNSGRVYAMVLSGSTLYVGGSFSSMGGQPHVNLAAIDANTGAVLPWTATANNGRVSAMVLDGSTLYVGGQFNGLNGFVRPFLGAVDATTGSTLAWNPNLNNAVNALALVGATMYVGGAFTLVGSDSRPRVAAISTSTGLATSWNPQADQPVNSLSISGGTVFVGGAFETISGQPRLRVAAIDAGSGAATPWRPESGGDVTVVRASGSQVLVGGFFISIGGKARANLGAFDATTGAITSWDPSANGLVRELAVSGSTVYAGGQFTTIGGQSRNRLAALSTSTGLATSWNPNPDGPVIDVVPSGSLVYVCGQFSTIGGAARPNIAALNASDGLATAWNPAANASVNDLLLQGGLVYAAGDFTNIGTQARTRLAALSPSTGVATAWNPIVNNTVWEMTTDGATLYVIGLFSQAGGALRNQVAAIDLSTGVSTAFDAHAIYGSGSIPLQGNIVYGNSKVYLASSGPGSPTTVGGQLRFLAELDPTTGAVSSFNPPIGYAAFTATQVPMIMDGTVLYLGGGQDEVVVLPPLSPWRRQLAAWDFSILIGVGNDEASTGGLSLSVGPNPTSGSARIRLNLPRESRVRVAVFDLQGREVARLADGLMLAGSRELVWKGVSRSGRRESGVYFVSADFAGERITKRLVVLR